MPFGALLPFTSGIRTKTPFEEFLLVEYNNIAQAHFNTVNSLSEFTKHYIAIVSIPISAALIFLKPEDLKKGGAFSFLLEHPIVLTSFLVVVMLVGITLLAYVVNLRCDALLYARTENGIRNYFYSSSGLNIEDEIHYRVLPKTTAFPLYLEWPYFFFVVLAFAIVGSVYYACGLYFYWSANNWEPDFLFVVAVVLALTLHILLYYSLGRYRERGYLRSHIIGIDIDGVLNKHREHFAEVLNVKQSKQIDPELITKLPVQETPGLNVTEQEANAVFNWPEYWIKMPAKEDAAGIVNKLRTLLSYKIWIFTHRDWPQPKSFPPGKEKEYWNAWQEHSVLVRPRIWEAINPCNEYLREKGLPGLLEGRRMIRKLTSAWLREKQFKFDKLIIEKGNTHTQDRVALSRNRFWISRERKIRVFVEDELSKAIKLADICEVVFLIDHPYNQASPWSLPKNIVRVSSWQEIHIFLRRVF